MTRSIRLTPALLKATAGFALTALLVAGCASKKSTPAAAGATSAAAAATSAAAAAGPASVAVKTGPLGAYLVDGTGRTLYLFNTDKGTTSSCYTKCAANWPAFVTGGAPQASAGATASMLGTTPRTDGSTQVIYNGHPLYYFGGDSAAGDTNGQGKAGTWWLVAPAGTEIGSAAAGAATSPSAAKTSKSAGGAWS
jgi:predicted lipoprotein with Yx(FWY)xxD motif